MFDVCIYGHPALRRKSLPVERFDDDLRRFVDELAETMYEKDGVGLAAPQVGRSIRVAVVDASHGDEAPFALVNPQIIWSSDETEVTEEGCLSIPEIHLDVERPARVTVRALNIDGKEYLIENAEGILARALQHEIDHLDGIMFVDRVSLLQRELVAAKLKKLAKVSREMACEG